jgi:fatty acid desaturase
MPDWLSILLYPATKEEITIFYLFWTVLYIAIHLFWEWSIGKFKLIKLKSKVPVLFSATSFATSIILLLSLTDPNLFKIVGDSVIPLIIAGLSGVLFGLSELVPTPAADSGSGTREPSTRRDGRPAGADDRPQIVGSE